MSSGKERARALRSNATRAERVLWRHLRHLKIYGLHFRRQAPFSIYVVDFVCHRAKLIVELDGSQHGHPKQRGHDQKRTNFLIREGYCVLRFWNMEVYRNPGAVADTILAIAREQSHLPHRGEVEAR